MTKYYAHYFKLAKGAELIISTGVTPAPAYMTFPVEGKAAARKLAATHNAKPWNF